jgi:hypothetical protein
VTSITEVCRFNDRKTLQTTGMGFMAVQAVSFLERRVHVRIRQTRKNTAMTFDTYFGRRLFQYSPEGRTVRRMTCNALFLLNWIMNVGFIKTGFFVRMAGIADLGFSGLHHRPVCRPVWIMALQAFIIFERCMDKLIGLRALDILVTVITRLVPLICQEIPVVRGMSVMTRGASAVSDGCV